MELQKNRMTRMTRIAPDAGRGTKREDGSGYPVAVSLIGLDRFHSLNVGPDKMLTGC